MLPQYLKNICVLILTSIWLCSSTKIVCSAWELLGRPDVTVTMLAGEFPHELGHLTKDKALVNRLGIEARYTEMVAKQQVDVMDVRRSEALALPRDIPYHK